VVAGTVACAAYVAGRRRPAPHEYQR